MPVVTSDEADSGFIGFKVVSALRKAAMPEECDPNKRESDGHQDSHEVSHFED